MEIYTLKEASRKTKIGVETLKRACEEGLYLRGLTKRIGKKRYQPYSELLTEEVILLY